MIFANIVQEIQKLSSEEKEDLKALLEKYIIEDKRQQIHKNYKKALKEQRSGKLKFSDDIDTMKKNVSE